METVLTWLQKMLLEKWVGRAIAFILAVASGWLSQYLPAALVQGWVAATQELLIAAAPLVIAWLLSLARYKVALNKIPPMKLE